MAPYGSYGWHLVSADDHITLELAHNRRAARGRCEPLEQGEAVPGCACPNCTGIPPDHPVRTRRRTWRGKSLGPVQEHLVAQARAKSITAVCRSLGLGTGAHRGRELAFHCPLHDDRRPSLRVNEEKGVCYCDVCGVGGDLIWLVRAARRVGFAEAVRRLAGGPPTY